MTVSIVLIVAVAENGVIGSDGAMPWRLSTDLKRFKSLTMGRPILMGRKTFQSIGKALPGRISIVVTRDTDWQSEGVVVAHSVEAGLAIGAEIARSAEPQTGELCVIGGGEIYAQTLGKADVVHLTTVHASPDGDTVFPALEESVWEEMASEYVAASEQDSVPTTFRTFKRRNACN